MPDDLLQHSVIFDSRAENKHVFTEQKRNDCSISDDKICSGIEAPVC
jgi:hypothetical protein